MHAEIIKIIKIIEIINIIKIVKIIKITYSIPIASPKIFLSGAGFAGICHNRSTPDNLNMRLWRLMFTGEAGLSSDRPTARPPAPSSSRALGHVGYVGYIGYIGYVGYVGYVVCRTMDEFKSPRDPRQAQERVIGQRNTNTPRKSG